MAEACDTHSFWELLRVSRWFVREDTTAQALSMVVEAQGALPMAKFWGAGVTSSSDGQHFTAGGMGEAMNASGVHSAGSELISPEPRNRADRR